MKIHLKTFDVNVTVIGEGVAMVLLHGLALDHRIWLEMIAQYAGKLQFIIPDARGHGQSDAPDGVYSMEALAGDVVGILDHLNIGKAWVAGHSMGGYIALAMAQGYPERMHGLGLIASRAEADSDEKKVARLTMAARVSAEGAVVQADALAPLLTHDINLQKRCHQTMCAANARGLSLMLEGMAARKSYVDELSQIVMPALVVAGGQDQLIAVEQAKAMAAQLKNGALNIMPGCGHMPMCEAPSLLADVIQQWVACGSAG